MSDTHELVVVLGNALLRIKSARRQLEAAADARTRILEKISKTELTQAEIETVLRSAEDYAASVDKMLEEV